MVKQRNKKDVYLDNTTNIESRYKFTGMTVDSVIKEGTRKFDIYTKPEIDTTNIATWVKHRVTEVDYSRIDNISYLYYDRPDFWWAIAIVNEVANPLEDISVGDTLFIPPLEEVQKTLRIKE